MKKAINIFKENYGYAYLKDLKAAGIHTSTIRKLIQQGTIVKIKPGLYKLSDLPQVENQGMIDIYMAMPKAVVCLTSALAYYELTTFLPGIITISLPRDEKPVKLSYPPQQIFYFSYKNYIMGIKKIKTESGYFNIYEKEKTIADCFRYRNKMGLDIALEGLNNYLSKPEYDINKLTEYARKGRMYKTMKPYMEAFLQK
ncbi:MAG: type IV toxin-antitoxin system AbiEi family antitoxin domain-containing protein [Calditrichales bacterium]|nr:type IV toxin-antitoxin system AbiEi family antitoxin domain-containing protein [Calditrichales bacterium]